MWLGFGVDLKINPSPFPVFPSDRKSYERYIADCRSAESSMETSWLEGHEKGIEKVALEMIKDGESNEKITRYTGLSDDEIERL